MADEELYRLKADVLELLGDEGLMLAEALHPFEQWQRPFLEAMRIMVKRAATIRELAGRVERLERELRILRDDYEDGFHSREPRRR